MSEKKEILCPYCGSDEVSKPRLSGRWFALSLLLFGIPFPFNSRIYHCFDCGRDFKKKHKKDGII